MSYRHEEYVPPESRPLSAPPHPHAYKKPNITLEQLDTLRGAIECHDGRILAPSGICRALVNRKLARRTSYPTPPRNRYFVTGSGRLLIRTQYAALKKVLSERRK